MNPNKLDKAFQYEIEGLNFAALKMWEGIYAEQSTDFVKIRYANQLSACGYFSKARALFAEVDLRRTTRTLWYMKHQYLAQHFLRIGNLERAQFYFTRSLQLRDDSTVPYVLLSNCLMAKQTTDEAIHILESALSKPGDTDEVAYNLARAWMRKGDALTASKYVMQSLRASPDYDLAISLQTDITYYQTLETMDSPALLDKVSYCEANEMNYSAMRLWKMIWSKESTQYHQLRYADQLRLGGFFEAAEKLLLQMDIDKILERKRFIYHLYLSQVYYEQYNWTKAVREIKKCFKYKPTPKEVYLEYVKFLALKEQHTALHSWLITAVNEGHGDSEMYYQLSISALHLKQTELALKYIQCCIDKDNNYHNAHTLLKDILLISSF
jgi:tetratricopeptide (TPR) repeat protein